MYDRVKIVAKKPKAEEFKTAQTQKNKFNNHSLSLDQILFLQRTIGNQAVERMVRNVHSPLSVVREQIQAKLKIGQPNDIYEQEADRVAEQIVSSQWSVVNSQKEEVQRQIGEEEEKKKEELIQTKPIAEKITPLVQREVVPEEEEEREETLQPKEMQSNIPEVPSDFESRIRALRGGGQPLTKPIRAFFEPRFGYNFSQVHIHNDPEAAKLARALNAEAFTYGRDIYFREGRYNPGTLTGKRLLAHELVHVVQQTYMPQGIYYSNNRGKTKRKFSVKSQTLVSKYTKSFIIQPREIYCPSKLTWGDFMGKVPTNASMDASTYWSITRYEWEPKINTISTNGNCKIGNKNDKEFRAEISISFTKLPEGYFDTGKSWAKARARSQNLLRHEQGHFDITCVMANKIKDALGAWAPKFSKGATACGKNRAIRKAKKAFNKQKPSPKETLKTVVNAGLNLLKLAQAAYDLDTNHGRNQTQQNDWLTKIQNELPDYNIPIP